jgi:hypothetical protein
VKIKKKKEDNQQKQQQRSEVLLESKVALQSAVMPPGVSMVAVSQIKRE